MNFIDSVTVYINNFFDHFNIFDDTERTAALCFAGVILFAVIIRIIVSAGYQSKYAMFSLTAKEIKDKSDILKIKGSYLSRVLLDYSSIGERGVGNIDVNSIVEKNLLRFSFVGWNYKSMESFVASIEQSILFLGAISVFLMDSKIFFGVMSLALFIVTKLFASIFDFNVARQKLYNETIFYLNKELGKFYITDTSNALTRLKLEIKSIIISQSKLLDESIQKLALGLTKSIDITMENISRSANEAISRLAAQAFAVNEPMAKWAKAISKASEAQEMINKSIETVGEAVSSFSSTIGLSGNSLDNFIEKINENSKRMNDEITRVVSSISDLKEVTAASMIQAESAAEALAFVKTNQGALEKAVSQYEISLKNITSQMGDAFGKIVDFHMQSTYNSLNDSIKDNIRLIINSNSELLTRLQDIFTQMQAQSRSEAEAMLRMKEQMDVHFERLQN